VIEQIDLIFFNLVTGFLGAALVYMVLTLPARIKEALRDEEPRRRATDLAPK
jgi:hypothetical protein